MQTQQLSNQYQLFQSVENFILTHSDETLPDRIATALIKETHTRQFNTICGMIGELQYYVSNHRAQLPVLNSIVSRMHQLYCFSNEVYEPVNRKLSTVFQVVLIALCKCINTSWVELQLSLNRLLTDINRHFDRVFKMVTHFTESWIKKRNQFPPTEIEFIPSSVFHKNTEDVCGICLETHKKKQTLDCPCQHSFGKKCFKGWMQTCQRNGKAITCPSCRQSVDRLKEFRQEK